MIRPLRNRREIDKRFQVLQETAVDLIQATDQHDLLSRVVTKAIDLLACDGGSLYLGSGESYLTFEVAQNRTIAIDFERTHIPVEGASIAAYVFRTAEGV